MKKLTKILLALVVSIAMSMNVMAQTAPTVGDGSSGNPYQITTLENLLWLSASDILVPSPDQATRWSSHYIQTTDIDATSTSGWNSGLGFSPIGDFSGFYSQGAVAFSGHYNGNNFEIQQLTINRSENTPTTSTIGLFGYNTGTVENLGVTDAVINANRGDIGALVGWNAGIIKKCYSTGSVTATGDQVGGLVGEIRPDGSLENSYSRCTVSGVGDVGGLVGLSASSMGPTIVSITNCYSSGAVSGSADIGGLIGNGVPTITSCYWDTETSTQSTSAGGTGKLTAQMKTQGTFTGWNFNSIWGIDVAINDGYPNLETPSPSVPVSDWALYLGILLMGTFMVVRYRNMKLV